MRISLLLILIIIQIGNVFGQRDTLNLTVLSMPILNCEVISFNSQKLLCQIPKAKFDSIKKLLNIWESKCGKSEPILRLRILIAIEEKNFNDSLTVNYINKYYIEKYQDRIISRNEIYVNDIYEQNKGYFDYVPLNGGFDSLSKEIAISLLPDQEKGTTAYFFCLLYSDFGKRFEQELYSSSYYPNYITNQYEERKNLDPNWIRPNIMILSGIWQPIGRMQSQFKTGFLIGIQGGFYINKTTHLDLNFIFKIIYNSDKFEILRNDTIYSVSGKYSRFTTLSLTKIIPLKRRIYLDLMCGIGWDDLYTDKKKIAKKSSNSENYENISAFGVNGGFALRKKIFRESSLGICLLYQYVLFEESNKLKTSVGDQLLNIGLIWNY